MKINKSEISVTYDKLKPGFMPTKLSAKKVKAILELLLKEENINKAVSIVFTNNKTIKRLNRLYRYRNIITDVLSFEYGREAQLLGEIIISLETARKQAIKYGNSFSRETVILLIHGFYHILGHEHYRKAEYHKMKKKEAAALELLVKKGLVK